ncbi:MAG: hypothetical protein LBU24_03195 [Methanocalculaceae archaeon]|jgi:hypothetical protein|nr:hypothetical protein [Methanocalculaceae archaeon]
MLFPPVELGILHINKVAAAWMGLLIFVVALSAFMSVFDGTIVNIAIPTILEIFDLSAS